jgi:glycosyltransferase involved in cell wall biosynthesis
MKVAIVSSTYLPTRNGVTIHIQSLVKGLEAEGHDVYVISPSNGKERFCKNDYRIASIYNPLSKLYPLSFDSRIPRAIKDIKFDIVHLHHPIGVYGLAKKISEKSDCPIIFTNHTQYLAYINYYTSIFRGSARKIMLARLNKLYGEASVVIGSTKDIKNEIHKINPAANMEVIPVGFDESRFDIADNPGIRRQIGIAESDFFALYVGRVSKEKNIDILLAAADKISHIHPDFKLVIVGPGDYLENTKKSIPSNVVVVGQPKDSDLVALYKHCDLFLSASVSEVLPLTFSEAAYSGAPLLGIDSLGVRDIIQNNINGLLAKDSKDFTEMLIELVGNRKLLKKLSQNAPKSVIKYSAKHNLKKVIDVYEKASNLSA